MKSVSKEIQISITQKSNPDNQDFVFMLIVFTYLIKNMKYDLPVDPDQE